MKRELKANSCANNGQNISSHKANPYEKGTERLINQLILQLSLYDSQS